MELKNEHRSAIEKIKNFIYEGEFYLAGGTAVYYYLKHRESIDLVFFTKKIFENFNVLSLSKDTVHLEIDEIKFSFFYYPYELLKPLLKFEIIKIASLEDILCMKVLAIIQRGSKKDFVDAYFIMNEIKIKPQQLIEMFSKKYGKINSLIIHKALTFFEDADKELELKMIKKVSWNEIKKFFIENFGKFE
ncbi:MAG: nucleotidyl transferase AbiEii/AbiGii toxin family protein [Candidatus Hydrothermia bacterium]|jgi:predicted nucleotidyltransferase component of viral defense system|nr:nucleotidyl transferase AbiEii/AbiGii toxin family protein [Candidatus Hydrothermia bacterium]